MTEEKFMIKDGSGEVLCAVSVSVHPDFDVRGLNTVFSEMYKKYLKSEDTFIVVPLSMLDLV